MAKVYDQKAEFARALAIAEDVGVGAADIALAKAYSGLAEVYRVPSSSCRVRGLHMCLRSVAAPRGARAVSDLSCAIAASETDIISRVSESSPRRVRPFLPGVPRE